MSYLCGPDRKRLGGFFCLVLNVLIASRALFCFAKVDLLTTTLTIQAIAIQYLLEYYINIIIIITTHIYYIIFPSFRRLFVLSVVRMCTAIRRTTAATAPRDQTETGRRLYVIYIILIIIITCAPGKSNSYWLSWPLRVRSSRNRARWYKYLQLGYHLYMYTSTYRYRHVTTILRALCREKNNTHTHIR